MAIQVCDLELKEYFISSSTSRIWVPRIQKESRIITATDNTSAGGSVTDEKWSLNPATPKVRPKTTHQTVCVSVGFRFSEYIIIARNDTDSRYREVREN